MELNAKSIKVMKWARTMTEMKGLWLGISYFKLNLHNGMEYKYLENIRASNNFYFFNM